jgi:sodium-dependent dicarboxylate transporter 2/3/5
MGKLSTGEKAVGLCFLIAAVLWFSGAQLRGINIDGWQPFKYLTDAVIAMGMGIVPFLIPVDRKGLEDRK